MFYMSLNLKEHLMDSLGISEMPAAHNLNLSIAYFCNFSLNIYELKVTEMKHLPCN